MGIKESIKLAKRKFMLLMWKNTRQQLRHMTRTSFQIFIPVVLCVQLAVFRVIMEPSDYTEGTAFKPFKVKLNRKHVEIASLQFIAYSPCNPHLEEIMTLANTRLGLMATCYENASVLTTSLKVVGPYTLCGVEFSEDLSGDVDIPAHVNFTIRFPSELRVSKDSVVGDWQTNKHVLTFPRPGPREYRKNDGAEPEYHQEGFLAVQREISIAFIKYFKKREYGEEFLAPVIRMQRFHYPSWYDDTFPATLREVTGLTIVCSFLTSALFTVKDLAIEKESQVKEAMKIMGLPNWLHWLAWFIKTFFIMFISALFMLLVFKTKVSKGTTGIITHSHSGIVLMVLTLYICATITLAFLISVFFNEGNTAAALTVLIWILMYLPYQITRSRYSNMPDSYKLIMCLSSNSAVSLAFVIIFNHELEGNGLHFHNLWESTRHESLLLAQVMYVLTFDIFLYMMIALYVEAVFPGEHGLAKPWYFPLTLTFWFGRKASGESKFKEEIIDENEDDFEEEPEDFEVGIDIQRLHKVFPQSGIVVDRFEMRVYEGQITVLLGHNGAGKSTLMNMLSGVLQSTKGTAIINGYDLNVDITGVRSSFGYCPQYNVIITDLTVHEHLYFFGKLKGLSEEDALYEVEKYVYALDISSKKYVMGNDLSEGNKRKLCVGIALCGDSRVVLLDEPTAGIDPASRHLLWALLTKEKKERAIFMITHFMDEADILSDRIAIIAGGRLQCAGSSRFLKQRFGTGYHLNIEKSPHFNLNELNNLLLQHMDDIKIDRHVGTEISYALPNELLPQFEKILGHLEREVEKIGVMGYDISLSTLEEVFMRVGAEKRPAKRRGKTISSEIILNVGRQDDYQKYCERKWFNQCLAMLLKKLFYLWHNLAPHIMQALLVILSVCFALAPLDKLELTPEDLPPLAISFQSYHEPETVISGLIANRYYASYRDVAAEHGYVDLHEDDLPEYVKEKGEENLTHFRYNIIIGATFKYKKNKTFLWFNNDYFHTPPLSLQYGLKALLRREVGEDFDLDVVNHPQPRNLQNKMKRLKTADNKLLVLPIYLAFALAFSTSYIGVFYVKERASGSKHMQSLAGTPPYILWGCAFLFDCLYFLAVFLIVYIIIAAYRVEGLRTWGDLGRLSVLLFLFLYVALPMTYLTSYIFKTPSSAFSFLLMFNVALGSFAYASLLLLKIEDTGFGKFLHSILRYVPHYNLISSMFDVSVTQSRYDSCTNLIQICLKSELMDEGDCVRLACNSYSYCCNANLDYYAQEPPGIGRNVVNSIFVGSTCFALLIALEYNLFRLLYLDRIIQFFRLRYPDVFHDEDYDIVLEKKKVFEMTDKEIKEYPVVVRDLSKYYGSLLAVNQMCLALPAHQCFGLLGYNGAGKTTTFKMLTGLTLISSGEAYIKGIDIRKNMRKAYPYIGYCPQDEGMLGDLTGFETLVIFALIRGIAWRERELIAENIANKFDLLNQVDKQIKVYSGGTKRKLIIALSLIGAPLIICLDEPTTGIDPATKKHIWANIVKLRDEGACVILTTHSMAECEALCTRLTIMVNGLLKCIGTKRSLKQKYSQGYVLTVSVPKNTHRSVEHMLKAVQHFVEERFPSSDVRETYMNVIVFNVDDTSIPWSTMFGIMEQGKRMLTIEHYTIAQTSLEHVFLDFISWQRDAAMK